MLLAHVDYTITQQEVQKLDKNHSILHATKIGKLESIRAASTFNYTNLKSNEQNACHNPKYSKKELPITILVFIYL